MVKTVKITLNITFEKGITEDIASSKLYKLLDDAGFIRDFDWDNEEWDETR